MRRLVVLSVLLAVLLTACGGGAGGNADKNTASPSSSSSTSTGRHGGHKGGGGGSTESSGSGGGTLGKGTSYPSDVEADIVYREIDGQQLKLDACSPQGGPSSPAAAIVVIHGGGWVGGDKAEGKWRKLCEYFGSQGFVAFAVNYRLVPQFPFPAAIEDIQAAVEWLRQPEQVSKFKIDPNRIGAFGGSAGANLAALLGTDGSGSLTEGSRVAAVVSMSGPMDLTQQGFTLSDPDAEQQDTVLSYLNCTDVTTCAAAAKASPVAQVDPTDPPLFMTNSQNETVPIQQADAMQAAMQAAGAPVQLIVIPGTDHSISVLEEQPDLITQITQFFQSHLG